MDHLAINVLKEFPEYDPTKLEQLYQAALKKLDYKIIVLDDDPTGVQTVHDVFVYTAWDEATITKGFEEKARMFYILTNSRGLTTDQTEAVHREIGETIARVAQKTGQRFILISRSDSTMRGHFPLETEVLKAVVESNSKLRFDGEIIAPFFQEGGRYTIDNVHYVKEGDELVPAGQTEFAKDKSFGYKNSDIPLYIEEKTSGRFKAADVITITLAELRSIDIAAITEKLMKVTDFNKVVVNAIDYQDIKVFTVAYVDALLQGKNFIFRSAAAIPKIFGGVSDVPLLTKAELIEETNKNGGIVIIGSHVNKTTQQFEALANTKKPMKFIEFDQHLVKVENGLEGEVERVVKEAEANITDGINVVVYTRRDRFDLDTTDKNKQLEVSIQISDAITNIIGKLKVRPSFIIAKGGITSSEIGTKALRVQKALVMGQIKPGIPVWMTGEESKFPHMPYVIFPGNVGEIDTLKEIVDLLS